MSPAVRDAADELARALAAYEAALVAAAPDARGAVGRHVAEARHHASVAQTAALSATRPLP